MNTIDKEEILKTSKWIRFIFMVLYAFIINFGYFAWLEFLVGPNSNFPVGKITTGLPYPFMNDMLLEHRLIFMVMCFLCGALLAWILTKFQKSKLIFRCNKLY